MTADAGYVVQAAVFAALSAAPPIGAGVYDRVPEGAPYPQIEISGGHGRDWSFAAVRGEQITIELHVWSRYDGYLEARDLMSAARARLDQQILPLADAVMVELQYLDSDLMLDADQVTRHGIVRLQATVVV